MTTPAAAVYRREDAPRPPPKVQWAAIGVGVAVLVHGAALVAWAAKADARISHLEESVPPGSVARLEERSLAIKAQLDRIENRLDAQEPRP